ncbi:hypothetical protein IAD21_05578 [Abditibacteriota bacterium]|nr:hypothetical protein IAD21_05578 [Abditibacteriota bacterium]
MKNLIFAALVMALFSSPALSQGNASKKAGDESTSGTARGNGPLASPESTPDIRNSRGVGRRATDREQYLDFVTELFLMVRAEHHNMDLTVHQWRAGYELWQHAVAVETHADDDGRFNQLDPQYRLKIDKKDMLAALATLERSSMRLASIDPVPTSCVDIDMNLIKYQESLALAATTLRSGMEAVNTVQVGRAEQQLSDALLYLNEAAICIKRQRDGIAPRKNYIVG